MNVCMYVCSKWKGVPYHLWAKMLHPEDPPHIFWKPQKHVGGVYFMWSGEIFLRNFLPYPPPPNIPGLKGAGCHTIVEALQKNATEIKLCRWEHPDGKFDWTWGVRSLKPQCLPPFSRVNIMGFRDTCLPFQRHPDQSGRSEPANALSYIQSTRNLNTNFAAMHDHACILHWV